MTTQAPDLSIAIVTYNSEPFIAECLETVLAEQLSIEVFVVDNNSRDRSTEIVRHEFPEVKLIENTENYGFAKANNQALRQAKGRYILLLNPDIVLHEGCLETMVRYLERNADVGAVAPRAFVDRECRLEICVDKPPTLWDALCRFTFLGRMVPKSVWLRKVWEIDWQFFKTIPNNIFVAPGLGGAYFMTRRELVEEFGYLDERFFLDYEDTDWSMLIRKKGLDMHILPDASLVHFFGQSKKGVKLNTDDLIASNRSLILYLEKHYGSHLAKLFIHALKATARLRRWKNRKPAGISGQLEKAEKTVLKLEWEDAGPGYLLEFSNDSHFLDKVAVRTEKSEFEIALYLRETFFRGRFFWRVYLENDDEKQIPLARGEFGR